ncbi:hypothetical protein IWQ54_000532 [Labrenzia sp. EL_195]|nr:hypothetical protein [Labrenzia sp. EL_195]
MSDQTVVWHTRADTEGRPAWRMRAGLPSASVIEQQHDDRSLSNSRIDQPSFELDRRGG